MPDGFLPTASNKKPMPRFLRLAVTTCPVPQGRKSCARDMQAGIAATHLTAPVLRAVLFLAVRAARDTSIRT